MKAKFVKLGVKFDGQCPVCKTRTGSRPWELEQTALYQCDDGKFVVAHPRCVGGTIRHRVGSGVAWATRPKDTIDI